MSAPTPPASRQPTSKRPRPTFTPEFLARCAGYTLAAQVAAGCPAPQVRPERERCPAETANSMRILRVSHVSEIPLVLDVNQPGYTSDRGVYRTGKYMGQLGDDHGWAKAGWRVEGYLWTEGKYVVGRYTKLFPAAGAKDAAGDPLPREVPVCIEIAGYGETGEPFGVEKEEGSTPGAVVLRRTSNAKWVHGE